jgi:hypothetical protein
MGLKIYRSGGSWYNWVFQVVDVDEIKLLKEERDELRIKIHVPHNVNYKKLGNSS